MASQRERDEFMVRMGRLQDHIKSNAVFVAQRMLRYAKTAQRLTNDRIIQAFAAEHLPGWGVALGGDPRGYVVTLVPPGSRGADYSSDNLGVPS